MPYSVARQAFEDEFGEDWCRENIWIEGEHYEIRFRSEKWPEDMNRRAQAVADALMEKQREAQIERSAARAMREHTVTILGPDGSPRAIPARHEEAIARKSDQLRSRGKPGFRPGRLWKRPRGGLWRPA